MRKTVIALTLSLAAFPCLADGFSLGGRYSNYATDLDLGLITAETGRQSSLGLVTEYRNGPLVLSGAFDHDFEGGISVLDLLPFDFNDYSRDRAEFAVGFAAIPFLDLEAGVRLDDIALNHSGLNGGGFFGSDFQFDHQALLFGVNVHSLTSRPIGAYATARGYVGTAEHDFTRFNRKTDTTGFKIEAGLPIAIGFSGWELVPAFEYERLDTEDELIELESNRFLINFVYHFPR